MPPWIWSDPPARRHDLTTRHALISVGLQFFVNGAVFASFIPRLPEIRDDLALSLATMGALIAAASMTGIISSVVVSRLIEIFGTRTCMITGGVMLVSALPVVGFAQSALMLFIGLAVLNVVDVAVDVAMNMQGSWLNVARPRPIMSRLHGVWSLGTVIGGLTASALARLGVPLRFHLLGVAAVLGVLLMGLARGLPHDAPTMADPVIGADDRHGRLRPGRSTLGFLAVGGAAAVIVEFTSSDWSAFRLTDDLHTTAAVGVLAYVGYTGGMTVGRFAGDWTMHQLGPDRLMVGSLLSATAGLICATLIDSPVIAAVGFVAIGSGAATIMPRLYDDAAHYAGRPGVGVAWLAGGSRIAGLLAPAVVGGLATSAMSVGHAMAIIVALALAALAYAMAGPLRHVSCNGDTHVHQRPTAHK